MPVGKFSSKGQLVVPKAIRDAYRWSEGTEVEIVDEGDGVKIKPRTRSGRYTADDLYGVLSTNGPARTLEEMNSAVDRALAERWRREGA